MSKSNKKAPIDRGRFNFKTLKDEIGFWLGLASSVIGILCVPLKEKVPTWAWVLWLAVIGIVITILSYKFVCFIQNSVATKQEVIEHYKKKIIFERNSYDKQFRECFEELHKYFHDFRDYLCSALFKSGNGEFIEPVMKNICGGIEAIFKTIWKNEKISVCIKKIVVEDNMNCDFHTWRVETIARSFSTKQSRNKNNKRPVLITENSDFLVIVSPDYEDTVFSCMDMTKVKQQFLNIYKIEYRNSTPDFLKYYKSTIVVPIRIQVDKMNPEFIKPWMKSIDYHLIGFLCIDTEGIFSGSETQFDTGIEVAKALADSLYKLFEPSIPNSRISNNQIEFKEYSI